MRRLLALSVALVLSGCFQSATVLTVRADGSATLRDEITLSGMALLAVAEAGDDSDEPLFGDSEAQARLATLGDGVRLASFESREDGYTAVYAIDDVREITLGPPSSGSEATEGLAVSFGFDQGAPSVLRVLVPKPERSKPSGPADGEEDGAEAQRMVGMMRGLLGEARLTVAVEVEGEVVDTNAEALEGSRLTLYDLPFGTLLDAMEDDPTLAEGTGDPLAQMERMRGIEGIRVPMPGTLRVRFQ